MTYPNDCKKFNFGCYIRKIVESFWSRLESDKTSCLFQPLQTMSNGNPYVKGVCKSNDKYQKRKYCIELKPPFLTDKCRTQCKKYGKKLEDTVCNNNNVICRCIP